MLKAGDLIGVQGQTGNATGIHTHWEYWVGGRSTRYRQDPSRILGIPNAVGKYDVTWSADNPPGPGPEPPTPGKKPIPVWLLFKLKEVKVALRKESVDRNCAGLLLGGKSCVALRKESVDRNYDPGKILKFVRRRSPQGERG